MSLSAIFNDVQRTVAVHLKNVALLEKYRTSCSDDADFLENFFENVLQVLLVQKKEPSVERIVKFVLTFAAEADDAALFLLEKLLPLHSSPTKAVRARVCQLLSGLLECLGEDAEIRSVVLNGRYLRV